MKKLSRCRTILGGLSLTLFVALSAAQNVLEGDVYVVDLNASLEQAIGQALTENRATSHQRFWVVISGSAVTQATESGATPAQQELIKRARGRGGLVYACESDLLAMGIKQSELLSGIQAIRGFEAEQEELPLSAQAGEIALPRSDRKTRLILRVCAERDAPAAEPPE